MAFERLRLDELAGTWVGDPSTPFHVGLLGVFDGEPFRRPDGSLDAGRIRDAVALRAARVPALRRRVVWTRRGEGLPVWVEDPTFDAARHVVPAHLPTADGLPTWAANRTLLPLHDDRPLWRVDVVEGVPDGRFALLVVVHHVLADGLAGLRLAASLLDGAPDAVVGPVPARDVAPLPSHRRLVADRVDASRAARRRRAERERPARRSGGGGLAAARAVHQDFRGQEPTTSLPRRVGAARRMVEVTHPLDGLREAGHALGVTLNDVVLAAVTEGLRDLLAARGELSAGMELRTTVPVASGSGQASGMLVVPLPVGEPDPAARLVRIHGATSAGKARLAGAGGGAEGVLHLPVAMARPIVRWGRRWGSSRVSLAVSNVPGPTAPLWLAGARMLEAVPIAPLVPLVPLSVAALSYAGTLAVSVNADAAVVDLDVMGAGVARALGRYGR